MIEAVDGSGDDAQIIQLQPPREREGGVGGVTGDREETEEFALLRGIAYVVVATRELKAGEEVFMRYGRKYWNSRQ